MMIKFSAWAIGALLLLPCANQGNSRFARFKQVEAYEVRPGILAMPRYAADGQVCEIAFEKVFYTTDAQSPTTNLSVEEIHDTLEDLAPEGERGSQMKGGDQSYLIQEGSSVMVSEEYQNVVVITESEVLKTARHGKPVEGVNKLVKVRWKNRQCR